jgi:IMP dehydrogenase
VIDIAHGHHESAVKLVKLLKKKFKDTDVVAGNVATAEGTVDLIKAGADAIKIGIGPGKACSTRVVSGSGMPQFTAVSNCALAARKFKVSVIADGGLKNSGDLAKAIGAGADTVMIGGLFAGTAESPGDYFLENGAAFKVYRGLASREASADRGKFEANKDRQERAAEGISTTVSYKGEVALIVQMLLDGLQSGMSYSGAKNILEFWKKVSFVRVSEAGIREGQPRP